MLIFAACVWSGCLLLEAQATPVIHLLFTGDVQGSFEPCGCAGGPTGGLARWAGYARSLIETESGAVVHVDAGNYFAPAGAEADRINRLMLESLQRLPVAVLNLGADDAYWWKTWNGEFPDSTQVVAANLVPRRSGLPTPKPYAVVEQAIPGQPGMTFRIGFIGLVDPLLVKPISGFQGTDPVVAVDRVKKELQGKVDWIVVLVDTIRPGLNPPPQSLLGRLLSAHPDIDLVITTEKRFVKYEPVYVGRTLLLSSIERGRFLGDLKISFDEEGKPAAVDVSFVEMKVGIPEEPELLREQRILHELLQ
jgi:2',3'-cyclic-nucleotide 2'-phosphodiesterase (5'-nucleotidase family)